VTAFVIKEKAPATALIAGAISSHSFVFIQSQALLKRVRLQSRVFSCSVASACAVPPASSSHLASSLAHSAVRRNWLNAATLLLSVSSRVFARASHFETSPSSPLNSISQSISWSKFSTGHHKVFASSPPESASLSIIFLTAVPELLASNQASDSFQSNAVVSSKENQYVFAIGQAFVIAVENLLKSKAEFANDFASTSFTRQASVASSQKIFNVAPVVFAVSARSRLKALARARDESVSDEFTSSAVYHNFTNSS